MANLKIRPRRLRENPSIRALVRETALAPQNLIMPYFVVEGRNIKNPITSMPEQFQYSCDTLISELKQLKTAGVNSIILFGIPSEKDSKGSGAYSANGITQKTIRHIKDKFPEMIVIADLCLCEYTDHGHCGVIGKNQNGRMTVDNDTTLKLLQKTAVSQARSGVDIVAPSGMIDGAVMAIREAIDSAGFKHTPIMAYSAKYASAFYGPFRDAAKSAPKMGDRSGYQMDAANSDEAMREIELDIKEGADIIMVKPALAYLDILRRAKDRFGYPTAAYNVSGEYAMVKATVGNQWLDEKKIVIEMLTSIKRAGADMILTYWAKKASRWLT